MICRAKQVGAACFGLLPLVHGLHKNVQIIGSGTPRTPPTRCQDRISNVLCNILGYTVLYLSAP